MDVAEENTNNPARPPKIGPGERLQAARIKKGLTVEDVAGRMHLSNNILEAIEDNNFDEITAPIFVKGYLRAYARIVALSEDDMIEQYLDLYSEEDPPISSTSNMVPELSVKDARIRWTTYLVILVLGVLLAAWWWNKQQDTETPVSMDAQTSAVEENSSVEEVVVSSEVQAGSEALIDTAESGESAETVAQESAAVNPEPVPEPAEAEVAQAVETQPEPEAAAEPELATEPEPEVGDMTVDTESASTTQPESEPEVEVEAEQPAAAAGKPDRSAPTGSDSLQIIVHADTWGDVKDANNYQLVYDLLRADSSIELKGEAPFAVFLGNGHGVEILFNGEEIEVSPKIREDNTARLNVGS